MTAEEDAPEFRARIALEEARAGLAEQARALETYRTRALTVASVVAVVAGLAGRDLDGWSIVAVAVPAAVLAALVGAILWPRSFGANVRAKDLLYLPEWQIEPKDYLAYLARFLDEAGERQERTLSDLGRLFLGVLVFAAVTIVALLATTGGKLG